MRSLTNILYNAAIGLLIGAIMAMFLWSSITILTFVATWTGNLLIGMLASFGFAGAIIGAILASVTDSAPVSRG